MARRRRNSPRGTLGKLKAAARHWVERRLGGSDELDDDLRSYGFADQIKVREAGPFRVWPENWLTVRAFMDLEFSWVQGRSADGSTCMIIAPEQTRSTLELLSVKRRDWKTVFDGIKIMEHEAVELLSESR